MIDAYEIGIQLALQDDVSAGLTVIARELAEMDRAVAASGAGLAALVRSAESAVRAVSAVAGVRPPAPVVRAPEAATRAGAEREAPAPAVSRRGDDDVVARGLPATLAVAPETRERMAAVPPESAAPPPLVIRAEVAPAVPPRRSEDDPVRPAGPAAPGPTGLPAAVVSQPNRVADRPALVAPLAAGRMPEIGRPAGAPLRRNGPVQGTVVARVERHGGVAQRQERQQGQPTAGTAPRPEVARVAEVLPGAARDEATRSVSDADAAVVHRPARAVAVTAPAAPRSEAFLPRGAAPQAEDRERGQAGGGTVMLDGRMVGYWLAEHMAREASRPPAGTSFFDPRQGPAWTPSGAL